MGLGHRFSFLQQKPPVASFVWQNNKAALFYSTQTLSVGFDTAPIHRGAELLVTGRQCFTWTTTVIEFGVFATTLFFLLNLSVFDLTGANKGNLAFGY